MDLTDIKAAIGVKEAGHQAESAESAGPGDAATVEAHQSMSIETLAHQHSESVLQLKRHFEEQVAQLEARLSARATLGGRDEAEACMAKEGEQEALRERRRGGWEVEGETSLSNRSQLLAGSGTPRSAARLQTMVDGVEESRVTPEQDSERSGSMLKADSMRRSMKLLSLLPQLDATEWASRSPQNSDAEVGKRRISNSKSSKQLLGSMNRERHTSGVPYHSKPSVHVERSNPPDAIVIAKDGLGTTPRPPDGGAPRASASPPDLEPTSKYSRSANDLAIVPRAASPRPASPAFRSRQRPDDDQ